jgi:hypothetical protein
VRGNSGRRSDPKRATGRRRHLDRMSPPEQRVARLLLDAREDVLVASAGLLSGKGWHRW